MRWEGWAIPVSGSALADSSSFASFLRRFLLMWQYKKTTPSAVRHAQDPSMMFETVGPWNSRKWNPVLVLTVVGLSILTLGATSASLFGLDLGFPILELVAMEGRESRGNLRVG